MKLMRGPNEKGHSVMNVLVDQADELADVIGAPDDSRVEVTERLVKAYPGEELKVLLLGPTPQNELNTMAGLLIVRYDAKNWRRVGVCFWLVLYWPEMVGKDEGFLAGTGWDEEEGIFGYFGRS